MSHEDSSETYLDTLSIGHFSEEDEQSQNESESPVLKRADANAPARFFTTHAKSAPMEMEAGFLRRRNATATEENVRISSPDAQVEDPETLFAMSCSPGNSRAKQ